MPEGRAIAEFTCRAPGVDGVVLHVPAFFDERHPLAGLMHRDEHDPALWRLHLSVADDWAAAYTFVPFIGRTPAWAGLENRYEMVHALEHEAVIDCTSPYRVIGSDGCPRSVRLMPRAPRLSQCLLQRQPAPATRTPVASLLVGARRERADLYVLRAGGAAPAPLRLLTLFDGPTWGRGHLLEVLAALVEHGRLADTAVLLVDSGSSDKRWRDLSPTGRAVTAAVDDSLLAEVDRALADHDEQLSPAARDHIVAGVSLGGLAALLVAGAAPQRFARAIALSPSVWRYDLVGLLADALHTSDELRIAVSAGHDEPEMLACARDLVEALRRRTAGDRLSLSAVSGGHDWAWWQTQLVTELLTM